MKIVSIIISIIVIVSVLITASTIILSQQQAQAKQKQIAGLDNNTAQTAMDNELRFLNIDKLHNATFDKQTTHVTGYVLFSCIKTALDSKKSDLIYNIDQQFLGN